MGKSIINSNSYNTSPNGESNNISINPKPLKFNFRKALLTAGVEPEVADAWMMVRKAKKAVNTKIAWSAIEREITLAKEHGHTPNECINLAVVKSWCGFKCEWMENEATPARSTRSTSSTSPVERNGKPRSGEAGYMDRARAAAIELGIEPFNPYE